MMSHEREMAIGFMLAFSEHPDKILDNIRSPADVDHLIAERNKCGKSQKAENLTKEPHDNINNTSSQNYVNHVNYVPINVNSGLTQDSVDTVFVEGKVDNYHTETTITCDSEEEVQVQNIEEGNIMVDSHDELDLWEPRTNTTCTYKTCRRTNTRRVYVRRRVRISGYRQMLNSRVTR